MTAMLQTEERGMSATEALPDVPLPTATPVERPSRYADRGTSLHSRLCGAGGTAGIMALVLAGSLFSWKIYQVAKAPQALAVFDVAPPAAPPEPQKETPPGPEKVEKVKPLDPDLPPIKPPLVQIASAIALPPPRPKIDPGPPVEKTTAPESKPLPPAPQQSNAKPTWEGLVLGALNKVKRYPREASFRRQQGVPYIRFVMDRSGKVLTVTLERSSGIHTLDQEALALPKRAQPLPKPPADVAGDTIELVVPVEFFMR